MAIQLLPKTKDADDDKLPDHLREFDDPVTARKWLLENTAQALTKRFPIENDNLRLELTDVEYQDKDFGEAEQKRALLRNRRLTVPFTGTWKLIDRASNKVLDERRDEIMQMPWLSPRGTFIHNGNEYSAMNQSRLKSGVFARRRRSGEIESFFNIRGGQGRGFRLEMDPETGVMKMAVEQATIPLYPVLRAAGVADDAMRKSWGEELWKRNSSAKAGNAVDRALEKLTGRPVEATLNPVQRAEALRKVLESSGIDPDSVERTLGVRAEGVTPDVLLRAATKMVGVARGDEKQDDMNHPMFSNVLGIEDLIPHRIEKDAGRLARNLLYRANRDRNLAAVRRAALNPYVDDYLVTSKLAMPLEETNTIHLLEQMARITKFGEGGIGNPDAVTDEARDVNPGQLGFIDGLAGPEGLRIGTDVRAAYRTFKGRDRQMYAEFLDPRTQRKVMIRPEDTYRKTIAFPGQDLSNKAASVAVMRDGEMDEVPAGEVDYQVPSLAHMMSLNNNLNTMPTAAQNGREFYAAKFHTQFMPLEKGEVPLVDTLMPGKDMTFNEYYGRKLNAVPSKVAGKVVAIDTSDPDVIAVKVKGADGKTVTHDLVQNFPLNRMTALTKKPVVKVGDVVTAGQSLSHSNFTDEKTGALALTKNLRVAVVPLGGNSFEDAYVVTESAARKLATERLYAFDVASKNGVQIGLDRYRSLFPRQFTKDQLANITQDGFAKPGTVLRKGDPIVLATAPRALTGEDIQLGKLHKSLRDTVSDKAEIWDHDYDGLVVDSVAHTSGARVNVVARVPSQVGDKLADNYGLKGVIGKIVPDAMAPRNPVTGEAYELIMNPLGVTSRVAPNAIHEISLGKVARKLGKQMRIPQEAPPGGWHKFVGDKLRESGLSAKDDVFDPDTGRTLKIQTGVKAYHAFHHLAEKKVSDRGSSQVSYTQDEVPAKGGDETQGAKRAGRMSIDALLAHGANEVLKDVLVVRGAKDDAYWNALRNGRPLPKPQVPFTHSKFMNLIRASGIQVRDEGDVLRLLPMTDKDVDKMSNGKLELPEMVEADMTPITGGLFDPGRTGGLSGKRWTHIQLSEPLPNPVFEEPIRRMLGLTQQKMRDIVSGREDLDGATGGAAIKSALSGLDIDREIARHRDAVKTRRGAVRDNSVKVLGYLQALKENKMSPADWVVTKVPVLPPVFRPVSKMGDVLLQADLNSLYRDLVSANTALGESSAALGVKGSTDARELVYDGLRAAYGLGDAITPEGEAKRLKGAFRQVIGTHPKESYFQRLVISKPLNNVGRATATPDPNLHMDQLGIPDEMAWKIAKDYILRDMTSRGIPGEKAVLEVEKRSPLAAASLDRVLASMPVTMDRAPVWHKFNSMAFWAHRVPGDTIVVSPLITKGYTMDFDGDALGVHLPGPSAKKEMLERMLPSKNLVQLTDLRSPRYVPEQEFQLGLYFASRAPTNKPLRVFPSMAAARDAYREGKLGLNDPIQIAGAK